MNPNGTPTNDDSNSRFAVTESRPKELHVCDVPARRDTGCPTGLCRRTIDDFYRDRGTAVRL